MNTTIEITTNPSALDDYHLVMEHHAGVKAIRKKLGMKTTQFADHLGVSRRTVEGWESGREPGRLALRAIAAAARGL